VDQKSQTIKKKQTKRDIESTAKKAFILNKALELFRTYGYEKTTIADICSATGFSAGSLYHFYRSKESLLLQLSVDMSNIVINRENIEQKILDPYEPIMQYLLDYSSKWETLGVDLTSHIYRIFDKAYLNAQDHSVKALPYHESFADFIRAAQQAGTFDPNISAEDAADYFITIGRGLVYEWCLRHGSYGLTEKSAWFLPRIVKTFISI
jgi:AcrR family transcriptional regulator